ncbi:hypothetical protein P7C71_g2552, partial [Lecanoromycetidae sp. Uapishka_2]
MLSRLAIAAILLSAITVALPTNIKPRDVVSRDADHMSAMSESLDYVKPREAEPEPEPEPEHMSAMSESLDYVKPREANPEPEPEPEHMSAMSESLDYVKAAA